MAYSRLFIMLKQGEDCFVMGSRPPLGKCIAEYRNGCGRMLLQIQGVSAGSYRVCLIGDNKYWEIPVPVYVNGSGRGELRRNLDSDGICINPKDIKAAVVLSGSKTVLAGFTDGEFNWQKCMMTPAAETENKNSKTENQPDTEEKQSENSNRQAVCADSGGICAEDKPDNAEKDSIKSIIINFEKKVDEIREISSLSNEDYLFSCNSLSPFGNDDVVWVRAGLKDISAIKSLWKYYNNPFVVHNCRKYRHLLLGRGKYFHMLAVPCIYSPDYKTEARLQGFSGFKAVNGGGLKEGEFCYCVLKCQ